MRKYLGIGIATFLATLGTSLTADAFVAWDENARVTWQGPGYYVVAIALSEQVIADAFNHNTLDSAITAIAAGPFATKADCNAAVSAHVEQKKRADYGCSHYATEKEMFGS